MNDLLNRSRAQRSGRRVLAGPEEATVLGNLLGSERALGDSAAWRVRPRSGAKLYPHQGIHLANGATA
jgi:hypothetical protein